jgi:hypothetical protein
MRYLLVQRGVQLRLGPADEAELQEEIDTLDRLLQGKNRP